MITIETDELLLIASSAFLIFIMIFCFMNRKSFNNKYLIQACLDRIEMSTALLDFLDKFIMDICVREMEVFKDTHDLALSTKSNISDLISNTSIKVINSLNKDMLDTGIVSLKTLTDSEGFPWMRSMFSPSFLNQYIIDTTTFVMKRLLEKSIEDYEESK